MIVVNIVLGMSTDEGKSKTTNNNSNTNICIDGIAEHGREYPQILLVANDNFEEHAARRTVKTCYLLVE